MALCQLWRIENFSSSGTTDLLLPVMFVVDASQPCRRRQPCLEATRSRDRTGPVARPTGRQSAMVSPATSSAAFELLVLDPGGRIKFNNAQAGQWLAQGQTVCRRKDGLWPRPSAATARRSTG